MSAGDGHVAKIRVLVVDDHPVVRHGIVTGLSDEPDISVVGEAGDGLEAEQLALQLNPEVIILDVFMPKRSGLSALANIKGKLPTVRVLMLTVSDREEELVEAVRLGADGYVMKKSRVEGIADAVRKIAAGEAILSPELTGKLMKELRRGEGTRLSVRERELLELVSKGLSGVEIAQQLEVTRGTVSVYLSRLAQKLHLKNRAEVVAYALRHPMNHRPMQ